jgi:hypothetical protein
VLLPLHPIWLLPHLGCVEWICQVNGIGLFFHADDHRFAFSTHATHKMYGRVIFELLEICVSTRKRVTAACTGNDNNEAAPSDRPPLLVPAQMRPRPTVGTNAPEIIGGWVVHHIGTELAQTVPNN